VSRWPPEVTEALEPRAEELAGLQAPPAPGWCADATAPSDAELDRLLARATAPVRRPGHRPAIAWALAAALLLLGVMHLVPLGDTPTPEPVATVQPDDGLLRFGPSITTTGSGELQVLRADEAGTELALLSGRRSFEVDPHGERRRLKVHAGEVVVEVTGTRFTVSVQEGRVSVEVERGSVLVHRAEDRIVLKGGERWSAARAELETVVEAERESRPTAARPTTRPPDPSPQRGEGGDRVAPQGNPPRGPTPAEAWAGLLGQRAAGAEPDVLIAGLEDFLATHDDPALTAEAGALHLQLIAEQLPGEEILPLADAWLSAFPGHTRSLEIDLLRATIAREQLGDCALALPSYERIAAEATGDLRAHASAWAEHCRGQAG